MRPPAKGRVDSQKGSQIGNIHERLEEKLFCCFKGQLLHTFPQIRQPALRILGSKGSKNRFLWPGSADTHKAGLPLRLYVDTYITAMHKGLNAEELFASRCNPSSIVHTSCIVSCTGSLLAKSSAVVNQLRINRRNHVAYACQN